MFKQFPQPNNFQNQSQFITKQVTNIDEEKAYIVDPFNSYLFVDVNSGKNIYEENEISQKNPILIRISHLYLC